MIIFLNSDSNSLILQDRAWSPPESDSFSCIFFIFINWVKYDSNWAPRRSAAENGKGFVQRTLFIRRSQKSTLELSFVYSEISLRINSKSHHILLWSFVMHVYFCSWFRNFQRGVIGNWLSDGLIDFARMSKKCLKLKKRTSERYVLVLLQIYHEFAG